MKNRLILASESPRRYELLKPLGIDFNRVPSNVKEDSVCGESPEQHVLRLTESKGLEVGNRYPDCWVIAADTIVFIDGTILEKPESREEALGMLQQLNGREHRVLTGFSVRHVAKGVGDREAVQTVVGMKPLTQSEMEWYVRTGEPFDKAGGYAIQGIGAFMIQSIHGSYTNVVGLPMSELIQMMVRLGTITITDCGFQMAD